ncbi:unnamed protein product [Rhizophagus irregularis]|nr:unnamed protein product [Rhizophagus irregularis]
MMLIPLTVECGFRRVWMCEFSNSRRFFLSDLGHGFQWKFRNFLLFGFNYESNNCNFNCNNIYNIFLPILLTECLLMICQISISHYEKL